MVSESHIHANAHTHTHTITYIHKTLQTSCTLYTYVCVYVFIPHTVMFTKGTNNKMTKPLE